jgi:hypothetical protein
MSRKFVLISQNSYGDGLYVGLSLRPEYFFEDYRLLGCDA